MDLQFLMGEPEHSFNESTCNDTNGTNSTDQHYEILFKTEFGSSLPYLIIVIVARPEIMLFTLTVLFLIAGSGFLLNLLDPFSTKYILG